VDKYPVALAETCATFVGSTSNTLCETPDTAAPLSQPETNAWYLQFFKKGISAKNGGYWLSVFGIHNKYVTI
jgi:hypothetical protein